MPTEYTELVAALKETDIPFEEYGWAPRPEGIHGIVTLDFEDGSVSGDNRKLDRTYSASVDVFFQRKLDRERVIQTVEGVLRRICGSSWELNSNQHEANNRLFHIEWVCEVKNNPKKEG